MKDLFLGSYWGIDSQSFCDSDDIVRSAASGLGENGFINYFGLQRFGSGSVATHIVGAALLRGEWKSAVDLILDPREGERADIWEARKYYKETGDIDGTLRQLSRHLVAERSILQCLKKCPGNYLQALKAIPRTLRMMYAHSYQSYLWNNAASRRVEHYGIGKVVLGDLVCCKGVTSEKHMESVKDWPEDNSQYEPNCDSLAELSEATLPEEKIDYVKVVDANDILKGDYTFEDVVLPLPGSRVIYPANGVSDVYHDLAQKDAISLMESVHSVKEFSIMNLTGAYRRVFQRPINFEWELLSYNDANKPLVETDLDIISKERVANISSIENAIDRNCIKQPEIPGAERKNLTNDSELEDKEEKMVVPESESLAASETQTPQVALKLEFTLPTSCYATMAIRELLKSSTSVSYQKSLNA